MKNKKIIIISSITIIVLVVIGIILYYPQKIAILGYHSFYKDEVETASNYTMNIENFEEQMQYLHDKGYRTLSLDEYYCWKKDKCKFPRKSVVITFDDGYLSNYMYALEVLNKYNFKATIFTIGAYVPEKSKDGKNTDYMSLEQINQIKAENENISFASHTYNKHYEGFENKDFDSMIEDIKNFNNIIETEYHAFPFGLFNENMQKAYKSEGYKLAFGFGPTSKEFRKSRKKDDDFNIPRLCISSDMSLTKFKLRMMLPF